MLLAFQRSATRSHRKPAPTTKSICGDSYPRRTRLTRFQMPRRCKTAYAQEVANRLPDQTDFRLTTDFPGSGVDISKFGSNITTAHMTTYGVIINGTNYISGCGTRYGQYAFCGNMRLPSYSTAKSAFASMALMRLGQNMGPVSTTCSSRITSLKLPAPPATGQPSLSTMQRI